MSVSVRTQPVSNALRCRSGITAKQLVGNLAADRFARGRAPLSVLSWIGQLVLVLLAYWAGTIWPAATQATNVGIAMVSLVSGTLVFVGHGSQRVTALGLFSFACGLIIGYGGIQVALDPYFLQTPTPQTHLAIALAAATSC